MAKSKWPQVRDNLELIRKWAREGVKECDMAKALRVGVSTFEEYKLNRPELVEALKEGKQPFIAKLENNLIKRADGFEYEETKTYIKVDEDGKRVSYQEKTKKYYPPDVAANFILLKNKDKDENGKSKWSNDPAKLDLDKEMVKLKMQVEEMKLF